MSLQYEPCIFWDSPPRPLERRGYRLARVDLQHEMSWRTDASSFAFLSLIGAAPLFLIPRLQPLLPFNVSGAHFQKPRAAFKFHLHVTDRFGSRRADSRLLAGVGRIRRGRMALWSRKAEKRAIDDERV